MPLDGVEAASKLRRGRVEVASKLRRSHVEAWRGYVEARPTTLDPPKNFENRPCKFEKKYYLLSDLSESERSESK